MIIIIVIVTIKRMETRITYLISYNAINLSNETTFFSQKNKT